MRNVTFDFEDIGDDDCRLWVCTILIDNKMVCDGTAHTREQARARALASLRLKEEMEQSLSNAAAYARTIDGMMSTIWPSL